MKYGIFSSFIFLALLCGCAPRMATYRQAPTAPYSNYVMPVAAAPAVPYAAPEPSEVAMVDLPFKKDGRDKVLIILDAGHGGKDEGTQSLNKPIYLEKNLTMSTTFLVKNFLEQFGYKVVLTRSDDVFIGLEERAEFANKYRPAIFVSIHYNSAPSKEAEGIEVFYYRGDEDKSRSAKSKILAKSILDKSLLRTQAKSRGVKHANFAVIRETNMTAVLIEGGFLTNASELQKIKTSSYQKSLALGIAQGIQDYLSKENFLAENQ